jgi:hypothetical protein
VTCAFELVGSSFAFICVFCEPGGWLTGFRMVVLLLLFLVCYENNYVLVQFVLLNSDVGAGSSSLDSL